MNYTILVYSIYLPVTIALSIWIAKSLHKNTKAFLLEKFTGRDELATATNNLIQTGFYLIALGFSFNHMQITNSYYENGVRKIEKIYGGQETIEILAAKVGSFTLLLGILLFINFFIMILIQSSKKQHTETL